MNTILYLIREQDPLKQGLKQHVRRPKQAFEEIREQDPLKQGLKPSVLRRIIEDSKKIREQDPLKQGLKHLYKDYIEPYWIYS